MRFPWLDRSGKLSFLKLFVFIGVFLPGLLLVYQLYFGLLSPYPEDAIIKESGLWAIRFLILTLAVSPIRAILGWPKLISVRRTLGIATFIYSLIHLLGWLVDIDFDWSLAGLEIYLRLYLLIGFIAFLMMIPLALTSLDSTIKKLGGKNWQRIHRFVYFIGVLSIFHFYLLLEKLSTPEAQVLVGIFIFIMSWRLLRLITTKISFIMLYSLSLISGILTMFVEILYYYFFTTLNASNLIWSANWTFDGGLRPGWIVMFIGLTLISIAQIRKIYFIKT